MNLPRFHFVLLHSSSQVYPSRYKVYSAYGQANYIDGNISVTKDFIFWNTQANDSKYPSDEWADDSQNNRKYA